MSKAKAIVPEISANVSALIDQNKLYSVTRYLQLYPKTSTAMMTAFKKKYAKEAHNIPDWDKLWDAFINQKV